MSLTWHRMHRSCQVANQRVPGMNLLPPPQHCRLQGQRHTPSCPPIWYGFWGANSGSQAHKVCTVLPTDSPRKGLLAGEIIQSLQLNLRAQARPPISLHHDYSSSLHLLDNLSMKREHPALPYLTDVHLLLEWVYTLLLWKRTFFFCLHLNSLQHKMNDYKFLTASAK